MRKEGRFLSEGEQKEKKRINEVECKLDAMSDVSHGVEEEQSYILTPNSIFAGGFFVFLQYS